MGAADFIKAGQEIFFGKGTCALCHEIGKRGERCPDLDGLEPERRRVSKRLAIRARPAMGQNIWWNRCTIRWYMSLRAINPVCRRWAAS